MYGHKAFQITHIHATVVNSGCITTQYRTCCWVALYLALVMTVAIIPADATHTHCLQNDLKMLSRMLNRSMPHLSRSSTLVIACRIESRKGEFKSHIVNERF